MKRRIRTLVAMVLCAALVSIPGSAAQAPAVARAALAPGRGALVVENVGQWAPAARFQLWGTQGSVWLAEDGVWLTLTEPVPRTSDSGALQRLRQPSRGVALRLAFVGANPTPRLEPFGRAETRVSYFRGSDPAGWHADVPVWTGVRYVDLFPGVDLEVSGEPGGWGWRLIVREDSVDPRSIRLEVQGATQLAAHTDAVRAETVLGDVTIPWLQLVDAEGASISPGRQPTIYGASVAAPFGSALGATATGAVASTDGQLVYSTLLGGNDMDGAEGVAVDSAGRACVVGWTYSADFPTTTGALDLAQYDDDYDLFVSLLEADGSSLVYSTYLGGDAGDDVTDIVLDATGRAYLVGYTESSDFPTTEGAYSRTRRGSNDAFVAVLNPTGTALVYSTLLGGGGRDEATGIAVDDQGRAFVVGDTSSTKFPTTPDAFSDIHYGGRDLFVSVLSADGAALDYSTLIGGDADDYAQGIALDAAGRAYVCGYTESSDYPTTEGAFARTRVAESDVLVSVLDIGGSELVYSTLLGGSGYDDAMGIAVDAEGRAYVVGRTDSSDWPTTEGAMDTGYNGDYDAFACALDPSGAELVYSALLGGWGYDTATAVVLDAAGRTYVVGQTESQDFPTTLDAYSRVLVGGEDTFVCVLRADGAALDYGTFVGGDGEDLAKGIARSAAGHVYVCGYTDSYDFPTTAGAFDRTLDGEFDAFVCALQMSPELFSHRLYLPIVWSAGAR